MKKQMKAVVALLACALTGAAFAAAGETVTWTNTVGKLESYLTFENWTNEAGEVVTTLPTNGENIVFADLDAFQYGDGRQNDAMRAFQTVHTGQTIDTKIQPTTLVDPKVGSVTGDARHNLRIDTHGSGIQSLYSDNYNFYVAAKPEWMAKFTDEVFGANAYRRYFDVTNPNGFLGWWQVLGTTTRIETHPTDSFTPVFHNFYTAHRPVVNVPTGRVEIANAFGGNTIDKKGAGTLAIKSNSGEPLRVVLQGNYYSTAEAGVVELGGSSEGALEALLARAALHLDASRAATLTQYPAAEGTRISQWRDVRGGPDAGYFYAAPANYSRNDASYISVSTNPVYRADTPSEGLALVDFGELVGDKQQKPGRCLRIYPKRLTTVRAAFYAADCPYATGADHACILGDNTTHHFLAPSKANALYEASYTLEGVRYADISLNLRKVSYGVDNDITASQMAAMHVLAQDTSGQDAYVGLLGSREYYNGMTGGSRVGELILFTNDLTRAERMLVARYLNRKWRAGEGDMLADADSVIGENAPVRLAVPAGKTAKVNQVSTPTYLEKSGEGRLEIGSVDQTSADVRILGGEVAFKKPAVTTDAPAANPYLWLDASAITPPEDGLVSEWKDCRDGVELKATTMFTEENHVPRLIDGCGRKVVDFGGVNTGSGDTFDAGRNAASMHLPNHAKSNPVLTYDYFCVMRVSPLSIINLKTEGGMPVFWTPDMVAYRDGDSIASHNYRSPFAISSQWRVDGKLVDPLLYTGFRPASTATNFVLLSMSTTTPFNMDRLCRERSDNKWGAANYFGGFELAEVIYYSRSLTPEERRNTEAYLMAKWLGKTHPSQGAIETKLTVGDDIPVMIDTDTDMALNGVVAGGNGSVIKRGSGTATVAALGNGFSSVSVESGSITLPAGASTFMDEALHHFDASRLDTLDYTVTDGVTNITSWADIRGNGYTAEAATDDLATALPRLTTVQTKKGHAVTAVDFGGYSWRTNLYSEVAGDSATMKICKNGTPHRESQREAYVVFMDAPGEHRASLFGGTDNHDFQRNWKNGETYWAANTWVVDGKTNGCEVLKASSVVRCSSDARMDGGSVWTTPSAGDFHIFDYVASDRNRGTPSTGDWTVRVDAMAAVRGSAKANSGSSWSFDYDIDWAERGGILIAEQIAFSRILTAAEAKYVDSYLKYKWFGGAFPGHLATNVIDSVSVAAGASLAFTPNDVVMSSVKRLGGDGAVSAPDIRLTDALDVTLANGKADHLTVDGTVTLDGTLAVNVTVDKSAGKLKGGKYPILTATDFEGADDTVFAVNVLTDGSGIYGTKVVREGNTLYLEVTKRGSLILFR